MQKVVALVEAKKPFNTLTQQKTSSIQSLNLSGVGNWSESENCYRVINSKKALVAIETEMGEMQWLTVSPENRIVIGDNGGTSAVFTLKNPTPDTVVYK